MMLCIIIYRNEEINCRPDKNKNFQKNNIKDGFIIKNQL